jgi:hypothetical protein
MVDASQPTWPGELTIYTSTEKILPLRLSPAGTDRSIKKDDVGRLKHLAMAEKDHEISCEKTFAPGPSLPRTGEDRSIGKDGGGWVNVLGDLDIS